MLSWFAVDAEAPEEYKALSYKAYLMCFGSTGMFEQDDVENWVSLTNTAAGSMARRLRLNSRMGILEDDTEVVPALTESSSTGPGTAHTGYSEYNQRELLTRWADHLERPATAPATVSLGGRRPPTRADASRREPSTQRTHSSRSALGAQRLPHRAHRTRPAVSTIRRHLPPTAGWSMRRGCSTRRPTSNGWSCLTDDIHYLMPVRVTTALGAGFDTSPGMAHFDEDKYSLSPPRRPVPHRARVDRRPAVAAAPPPDQRADVRHRPTTIT